MFYTKFKKQKWPQFGLMLLMGFFSINLGHAKSLTIENFTPPAREDIIWMDSISVEDVHIDFSSHTQAGLLAGRISGLPKNEKLAYGIFRLREPGGAIFLESRSILEDLTGSGVMPFVLPITDIAISPMAIMEFEVYDDRNRLKGKGTRPIPRQENFVSGVLGKLQIKLEEGQRKVFFSFENGEAPVSLTPTIELYDRSGTQLILTKSGNTEEVDSLEKANFSLSFPEPEIAQVYTLKALVKDNSGKSAGGILEGRFSVEGLFAQIEYFDLIEADLKAQKVNFIFSGITMPVDGIEAHIKIRQDWEGEEVDQLQKSTQLDVAKNGTFKGYFEFFLEENADFFEGDLVLKKGEKVIGKKHLERKMFIAPNLQTDLEKQRAAAELKAKVEGVKWWMRKDWLLWGGITFIIFLIAFNGWLRLHRKLFLIFLGFIFFSNQVLALPTSGIGARVWWTHPVTSWFFNPVPDNTGTPNVGFENYSKIRMNASILSGLLLDSAPLFPGNTKPGFTLIHLTKGGADNYVAIDMTGPFDEGTGDGFTVTDNIRFEFEFNTATDTLIDATPLSTFLTEGVWNYELFFCIGGAGATCTGGSWYGTTSRTFNIDRTTPLVSLVHGNDVTQRLHRPRLTTDIGALSTQIGMRDGKKSTYLTLKQQRLIKNTELSKKVNRVRPFMLARKVDLTTKYNVLTFKLSEVNSNFTNDFTTIDVAISPSIALIPKDNLMNPQEVYDLWVERNALIVQRSATNTNIANISAEIVTLNEAITVLEAEIGTLDTQISVLQSEIDTLEDVSVSNSIPLLHQQIKAIKSKSKNNEVVLNLDCTDGIGAGCSTANYTVKVRGNFCDDSTVCNTTGTRKIKLCDMVGNCIDPTTHSNDIDWYDPVKPNIISSTFPSGNTTPVFGKTFKLDTIKEFRRDNTSTEAQDPTANYNTNACGYNVDAPLYDEGSYCIEKVPTCATSGVDRGRQNLPLGGACASLCDPGFIYDNGICYLACDQQNLTLCLPGVLGRGDCIDDPLSWSPSTSTWPASIPFMQENNCGKRRQAEGTG